MGITRRNFEDDGGDWWDHYRRYCCLYEEAVEDVKRKVSERR
jgi:hypothetical protein